MSDMTAPTKPGKRVVWRASIAMTDDRIDRYEFKTKAARDQYLDSCAFPSCVVTTQTVRILPPKPRLHGFEWALKRLREGKRVRRPTWSVGAFIVIQRDVHGVDVVTNVSGNTVTLSSPEWMARDWQLASTESP